MTESDFATLQRRYPTGRHEVVVTDTGIAVDRWVIPPMEALIVTLEPNNGDWTLTDDGGELIAEGSTVDEIVNAASV